MSTASAVAGNRPKPRSADGKSHMGFCLNCYPPPAPPLHAVHRSHCDAVFYKGFFLTQKRAISGVLSIAFWVRNLNPYKRNGQEAKHSKWLFLV